MTTAQIILLVLVASVFLNVFALGCDATLDDALYLFKRPTLLMMAVLSMNVVMVVLVVIAASVFDLAQPVRIALLALAVSPVPPLLPKKQQKAGGSGSYTVGLLVAEVALAIVLVPLSINLIGRYFDVSVFISPSRIALTVLVTALIPVFVGILVRHFAPNIAQRLIKPASILSLILLVAGALPILITRWGAMWEIVGDGSILALILFTVIGLAVGHFFGGPDPDNRTALALATAARHPGIALAIGGSNFPDQKAAIMAVILWHLIMGIVVTIPYKAWRKKQHAALESGGPA